MSSHETIYHPPVDTTPPDATLPEEPLSSGHEHLIPDDANHYPYKLSEEIGEPKNISRNNETQQDQNVEIDEQISEQRNEVPIEHPMITRGKAGVFKPKVYAGQAAEYIEKSGESEPLSVEEAMSNIKWKNAMKDEFDALVKNKTWKLVSHSPNMKVIGNKWVYRIKYSSEGKVQRFKARLVAKGFLQTAGVDFNKTFSPVIKAATLRIILTLAMAKDWEIRQIDINNAFLNRNLEETVYMEQPDGFIDKANPTFVCKLEKALYGLRQAPRACYEKLSSTLIKWKFKQSKADNSFLLLCK
ncbi:cysteine-rich RLK (RECEPTOR-like protein kinase) 8 [Abeliophyllum distichum]|uniref:Cysteine-rich RLK (RECEPTOR-like protein kinase) 8 n=1 Tax=Abeliophyllum distichum TaxID=126358 RepID=A0ABD1PQI3_9LAMI